VGGPPAWGLGGGLTTLPRKTEYLLRVTTHSLGTGRITWRLYYIQIVNYTGITKNTKG
jgi:hypothetical protein